MTFRVALLQIAPYENDPDRNLGKGLEVCRQASHRRGHAVFPELWPHPIRSALLGDAWLAAAIDRTSGFFLAFAALARELGMRIAITYLEAYAPNPRNSASVIDGKGEVVLNYPVALRRSRRLSSQVLQPLVSNG
jgi:predicted amidohydrolase